MPYPRGRDGFGKIMVVALKIMFEGNIMLLKKDTIPGSVGRLTIVDHTESYGRHILVQAIKNVISSVLSESISITRL
jgi:hypothetical protein